MRGLLRTVDQLLRGGFTSSETLRSGEVPLSPKQSLTALLLRGGVYGLFMGLYGTMRASNPGIEQMLADMFKVPLLLRPDD